MDLATWLQQYRWHPGAPRDRDVDAVLRWLREQDPVGEDGKVVKRIAWTRRDVLGLEYARHLYLTGRLRP